MVPVPIVDEADVTVGEAGPEGSLKDALPVDTGSVRLGHDTGHAYYQVVHHVGVECGRPVSFRAQEENGNGEYVVLPYIQLLHEYLPVEVHAALEVGVRVPEVRLRQQ